MNETSVNDTATVLITGGAKRIGAALVKAFHQKGMNVLFQYHHSVEQAKQLARSLNRQRPESVVAVCFDLQVYDNYLLLSNAVHEHFGRLDVLINNASAFFPTSVNQADEDQWNRLFDINAKAPFFLSRHCQYLLKQQHGSIINLTDIYARSPLTDYAIYCASKAALENITLSLAGSFAPDIRVNAIAPGAILAPEGKTDIAMAELIEKTPLKQLGGEASIVETALFLANQASFITGQTITVDGGRTAVSI